MKAKLCFFDDYYVASRPQTSRRFFKPCKVGEFSDDDASLQLYTSFFYDPTINKFRLYYEVPIVDKGTEVRRLKLATASCIDDFISGNVSVTTVSGLDDVHGIHGCSVAYNSNEVNNDKRYILIGNAHADDKEKRYFCRSFSADGMNFSPATRVYPDNSFSDYKDTYNSVYYNQYCNEYFATTRCAVMDRRIALIRSKDGIHWSDPQLILHPSSQSESGVQYYALGVSHLDGLFYGILWRFVTDISSPDFTDMFGYMENDLLYSYDGFCFSNTGLAPMCERPEPPEFGCKQLWLLNIEQDRDKYIICGGATNISHGSTYGNDKFATTVFYDIRKDGFCAIEGFSKNSIVYTKPFLFEGDTIEINYNALAGKIDLAILNEDGTPINGFGYDDFVSLTCSDNVSGKAEFKNSTLDTIKGKPIRLAIRLDNALLYSVSFEGRPYLHSRPQVSINNPIQSMK